MKQRQKVKSKHGEYYEYSKMSRDSSDGDETEETELFVRSKPAHIEVPTIEKIVEEGDTLQALSIRYHCSIAELKRLNNIHKENEIFAKRTIRVPNRVFTMSLAAVHTSGTTSPNENASNVKKNYFDTDVLNSKLTNVTLHNQPGCSNATDFNEVIFNSNIVNKHCDNGDSAEIFEGEDEEEVRLLPTLQTTAEEPIVSRLSCSGVDADISWITLIVCIVVVIFAIPLIYVFYIAEHPEVYQHHNQIS